MEYFLFQIRLQDLESEHDPEKQFQNKEEPKGFETLPWGNNTQKSGPTSNVKDP